MPVKPATPATNQQRGSGSDGKRSSGADSEDGKSSSLDGDELIDPESLGFAHLDDVCIKLLKKGNTDEALKYLSRMRGMIDTICTRLEPKPASVPLKPTAPKPRSARSSTKGLRSGRIRVGVAAGGESSPEGGSTALLPAIVKSADPVDTAGERLAAKDRHIDSLKAQLAGEEEKVQAGLQEVKDARAKAKEAATRLKKREDELQNLRSSLRREGREGDDARDEVTQLRGMLDTARQNAMPPQVSPEAHADNLQQIYALQQKIKKMGESLKKGETKQKVLNDQLTVAKEQAEAAKGAAKFVEGFKEATAALKLKKEALKRSTETVARRDAQLEALATDKAELESRMKASDLEGRTTQVELAAVKGRMEQTMAEYKFIRDKVEELTDELNSADMASAEMNSMRLQLADAEQIVVRMAAKSEKSEKKLTASGVELHNSAKAMKSMTTELVDVKQELETMKADTVKVRKRLGPLKMDVERLNKIIAEKQEKIDVLQDTTGKRQQKLLEELDILREEVKKIAILEEQVEEKIKEGHLAARKLEEMKLKYEAFAEASKELKDFEAERNAWARKIVRTDRTSMPLRLWPVAASIPAD